MATGGDRLYPVPIFFTEEENSLDESEPAQNNRETADHGSGNKHSRSERTSARGRYRGYRGSSRGRPFNREPGMAGRDNSSSNEGGWNHQGRGRGTGDNVVRPKTHRVALGWDMEGVNSDSSVKEYKFGRIGRGRGRGQRRETVRSWKSERELSQVKQDSSLKNTETRKQLSKDFSKDKGNDRHGRKEYSLGYKRLVEWSEMTDADDLVLTIGNSRSGLVECLKKPLKPDWLHRILQILSKAVQAQTCVNNLRDFLYTIEDTFLLQLSSLLGQIMAESETHKELINNKKKLKSICILIISFLKYQMNVLPSSLGKCYPVMALLQQVISEHNIEDEIVTNELRELDLIKETIKEDRETLRKQRMKQTSVNDTNPEEISEPPENFRELSILPSYEDWKSGNPPFLRQNVDVGKYKDLDHFLDIQFRLLREDYIRPLREGIRHYKAGIAAGQGVKKIKDIRLYHNVQVLTPVCAHTGIWYLLQFDIEPFQRVNWSASKRLLYGSLVCLSSDDFETVVFGTVTDRSQKDLVRGQIHVLFENRTEVKQSVTYKMAETTAYFEAYRHVLEGLQEIKTSLALQRYIVDCENDVNPPKYLVGQGIPTYDFTCVLTMSAIKQGMKDFAVLDTGSWPNEEDLSFDTSQMDAMKMALTKELSLIQGPPGTGKTYVGLKIAKMLLANKSHWMEGGKTSCPILVVCFTNHALDQFLEGIYSFCRDEIVRVGGQSSNTALEPLLLKNKRRKNRLEKNRLIGIYKGEKDIVQILEQNKMQIELIGKRLKATTSKIAPVMKEEYVDKIISRSHYNDIMNNVSSCFEDKALEMWLAITTKEQEDELSSMGALSEPKQLNKIWKDLILNEILPMSEEEATAITNVIKLDLYTRAKLYTTWIADCRGNLEKVLETIPVDQAKEQQKIGQQILQIKSNIVELKSLKLLPIGPKYEKQVEQLHQIPTKGTGRVAAWLCLDSSKQSTELIQKTIENPPADIDVFQDDDDLEEKRNLDDDDDDFVIQYKFPDVEKLSRRSSEKTEWVTVHRDRQIAPKVRKIVNNASQISAKEVAKIKDIWHIPIEKRHELYRYWVKKYRNVLKQEVLAYTEVYESAAKKYKEIVNFENLEILRECAVVGMTTTGAAKNRAILQQVKPKIIIVEEAAEVLEAHIITTLNDNCQHLILIGDHKQLRPNPTVYDLAKRYKLDVSLFERLIKNDLPCVTLSEQHRMRPEISVLMRYKHLYPDLKDHYSVKSYGEIEGVEDSVCFIDHTEQEEQSAESTSYFNKHEAQYLAALCRYLLLQGYTAEQITVLSPYMGQVLALRKALPKPEFEGVRITAVDNFQGEENDIVLLSLVRSSQTDECFSKRNPIGFLGIDNRVCVALSRAKKCLFVIGNFSLLASNSDMWQYMVNTMRSNNRLKKAITLYCQNHPKATIEASTPDDFKKAPEGGCKLNCDFPLKCGHTCRLFCHVIDKNHEIYKCLKPCIKINACGHKCQKKCFDDCDPCETVVEKEMPICGHKTLIQCRLQPDQRQCKANCNSILPCGHECARRCGDCVKNNQHRQFCEIKVRRKWPCGHLVETKCGNGPESKLCPQPCKAELNCKHSCSGTCGECFEGRIHKSCTSTCNKILPCGHYCSHNCSEICPPCNRPCGWVCLHGVKCNKRCYEECHKCIEDCALKCIHQKCSFQCHEICENVICDEPCKRTLDCGHPCSGLCREQCPTPCPLCAPENDPNPNDKSIVLRDCGCIVSVSEMDCYMERASATPRSKVLPLFRCPNSKCNKPINKMPKRYLNFAKKRRELIAKRYMTLTGTDGERKQESKRLQAKIRMLRAKGLDQNEAKLLISNVEENKFGALHNTSRTIEILEDLLKLSRESSQEVTGSNKNVNAITKEVDKIRKNIMVKRKCVTSQFWNETKREIQDLRLWLYSKDNINSRPDMLRGIQAGTLELCFEQQFTDQSESTLATGRTEGSDTTQDYNATIQVKETNYETREIDMASDEIVVASDETDI